MSGRPKHEPPRTDDGIRIALYEDAMRAQVVELLRSEDGGSSEGQERTFVRFYEHPFQRERGIRLVALDGGRVVAFQSFFYWPYRYGAERLASFQSGNSIVAPDYRGRRIFARLLAHLDELREKMRIDFLMGFPVEMSFGSFLRNHWAHPLDLSWYARVIHPLSVLAPVDLAGIETRFETTPEAIDVHHPENSYSLAKDPAFQEWRRQYRGDVYRFFHHASPLGRVRFDLKFNRRGRITELILGDVAATSPDPTLLEGGLRALVRTVRAHPFVTILTIALNRSFHDETLGRALRRQLFVRLKPRIHFIVKDVQGRRSDLEDASRWRLLRSDIDTW